MKIALSKKNMSKAITYLVIVIFMLSLFIYVLFFMYKNVYKTFVYTDKVLTINESQEITTVDIENFEQIKNKLKNKKHQSRADVFIGFE